MNGATCAKSEVSAIDKHNSSDKITLDELQEVAPFNVSCPAGYDVEFYEVPNAYGVKPHKAPLDCVKKGED